MPKGSLANTVGEEEDSEQGSGQQSQVNLPISKNKFPVSLISTEFPTVDMLGVQEGLSMARKLAQSKNCDGALAALGIPSLSALLNGFIFSGPNASVFDGRTSTLSLPIGPNRTQQTVANYFKENKTSVGAAVFHSIHGISDGDATFLGYGFYSPEKSQWITQQQAIILLHEAVHQVGKKGDSAFGGSKALSDAIIQGCYPALKGKLGGVG